MVTQTYNLSPRKVEAEGSLVQGNLGYLQFKVILGYLVRQFPNKII